MAGMMVDELRMGGVGSDLERGRRVGGGEGREAGVRSSEEVAMEYKYDRCWPPVTPSIITGSSRSRSFLS
jgi:hypothetical protein